MLKGTTGRLASLYKERCGKQIDRLTQYFGFVGTTGAGVLASPRHGISKGAGDVTIDEDLPIDDFMSGGSPRF